MSNSLAYNVRHDLLARPRSNVLPMSGVKSLVKSATTLIVSRVVSPIRILPPSVMSPVTSTLPLTVKLPITSVFVNNLIEPVPFAPNSKSEFDTVVLIVLSSMRITPLLNSAAFTTRQGFALVPRSKEFPASGTRSLVKSAITVTVSNVVSPMRIFPPSVISPTTSMLPLTFKLPVTFVSANNSIVPVPTVLTSKLLFVAVVSMRLPTI